METRREDRISSGSFLGLAICAFFCFFVCVYLRLYNKPNNRVKSLCLLLLINQAIKYSNICKSYAYFYWMQPRDARTLSPIQLDELRTRHFPLEERLQPKEDRDAS